MNAALYFQRLLFPSFVLLSIASCSQLGVESRAPAASITTLATEMLEYEPKFRRPVKDSSLISGDTQLWFPVTAGHFFGTANAETSWHADIDDQGRFSLAVDEMLPELRKLARPFDTRETGLLLEPADTRMARISSFAINEFDGEPLGRARWLLSGSRKPLLLAYFDRPCRVLGSLFFAGQEHRFDLDVPQAGLYWLAQGRAFFTQPPYALLDARHRPVLGLEIRSE